MLIIIYIYIYIKTLNTLSKFALFNGSIGSIGGGTYMAYNGQKYEDTIPDKIIGCSLGALLGMTIGFPAGVILIITSPIIVPVLVYNKYYD